VWIGATVAASASIVVNPSGVFAFGNLPGLHAEESEAADSAFWASPPSAAVFTLSVDDQLGRFLPSSFELTAPQQGVAAPACAAGWVPTGLAAVPLFSSPARQLLPGLAVVRAQLWDSANDRPAAYAVLQIEARARATPTATAPSGVADDQGRVLVAMPYPPLSTGLSSPPAKALSAQRWSVTPRVYYHPEISATGLPGHPDLCSVLGQPAAAAVSSLSPVTPIAAQPLEYGIELVIRTPGESTLLIVPGPSS
jgi:hypothetical protein